MAEILKSEIKLYKSQTLTDDDEGGGARTSNEVLSGAMNNLFTDSSRMDRVYGRISLRKAFPSVVTSGQEVYYGAHIMLTKTADDPLVTCWFITTEDWFDQRSDAASRIEGYLVKGPTFGAGLWGDHYENTSIISLQAGTTFSPPEVGDVIVLETSEDLGGATIDTITQYVRITSVETEEQQFTILNVAGTATVDVTRQIITIEIGTSLESDFPGDDITNFTAYTNAPTQLYNTVVADSSRFYSVSPLVEAASIGDLQIRVEDTKLEIVPSATSETGVVDYEVGNGVNPVIVSDDAAGTISRSYSFDMSEGARLYIGEGVQIGSFEIPSLGLTDNSRGGLLISGVVVGSITYATGIIDWGSEATQGTGTRTVQYVPACAPSRVAFGDGIPVTTNNRGFTWVYYCDPVPIEGVLTIEYASGGKWYTLWDRGGGLVRGSDTALGTASLNYITGSLNITLGELPDAGSLILIFWAAPADYKDLSGETPTAYYEFDLNHTSINPGTFYIDWTQNGAQQLHDDNSDGKLYLNGATGTQIGYIEYGTGHVVIDNLPMTPAADIDFDISYSEGGTSGDTKTEIINDPAIISNRATLTLSNVAAITPYSVTVEWTNITDAYYEDSGASGGVYTRYVHIRPSTHVSFKFRDDGTGGFVDETANSHTNWAAAVVTYTAGAGQIELSPQRIDNLPNSTYDFAARTTA